MRTEIVNKFAALITSAFGLVAALAWNDAIKGAFASLDLKVYAPWVYASIVTVLAVVITFWVGKLAERAKGMEKDLKK